MKKILIAVIVVLLVVVGYLAYPKKNLGVYLTSTVTSASSSVDMATSSLWAAGANLQRALVYNLGNGVIYCSFGTTAVSGVGMVINPVGSSTNTFADITDPNLLGKAAQCIASVTSTISVLKY